MSNILPSPRAIPNWFAQVLQREVCPAAEPYLRWLRQPLGWFALATTACVLIGVTIAPIAISLAAGLIGLMTVGIVYPWLAVRFAECELLSQGVELAEDQPHVVQIRIHNRGLWPLWGLVIQRFVVEPIADSDDDDLPESDIALGWVPWLSSATYRVSIRPQLRGRYPVRAPRLTCAFPFGLWTARRTIKNVMPLVVHPKQVKLSGVFEQAGGALCLEGHGQRSGGSGDFLGLREYRTGDSIRDIHWAHTARLDRLVVCQRGIAEQSVWHVVLDVNSDQPLSRQSRENLAWRVRIAASLCSLLRQQSIPFQLDIPGEEAWNGAALPGNRNCSLNQMLSRLTDVPLDGMSIVNHYSLADQPHDCRIRIEPVSEQCGIAKGELSRFIRLHIARPNNDFRRISESRELIIDLDQPPALQISAWLQKAGYDYQAA